MANIKSAQKRIKTTEKKTILNKSRNSEIKTYVKKFDVAIENGNIDEARELLKIIDRKLNKAAHKNVIHKNAVARKVSKLTKELNKKVNEAI